MDILRPVISYWYECIKNENILESAISPKVRKKAIITPFEKDHFIFSYAGKLTVEPQDEKLISFWSYTTTKGSDIYYGYPLLFYFDETQEKHLIAPLFVIKLNISPERNASGKKATLTIDRDEPHPTCGLQAFHRLGFKTEQIADINETIENLFRSRRLSGSKLLNECIKVIERETVVPLVEPLNPDKIQQKFNITTETPLGVYNKNVIFAAERTLFDIHLLRDLQELKNKSDLSQTALSLFLDKHEIASGPNIFPILPFPANEYQLKAIKDAFHNKFTVITGPPGTGKSQFIANLIINLFLEDKSVLFVSHTNEAINVVYEKINSFFRNLVIRTGKKELRQELQAKVNDLINSVRRSPGEYDDTVYLLKKNLRNNWIRLINLRNLLLKRDNLERKFEEIYNQFVENVEQLFEHKIVEKAIKETLTTSDHRAIISTFNQLNDVVNEESYLKHSYNRLKDQIYTQLLKLPRTHSLDVHGLYNLLLTAKSKYDELSICAEKALFILKKEQTNSWNILERILKLLFPDYFYSMKLKIYKKINDLIGFDLISSELYGHQFYDSNRRSSGRETLFLMTFRDIILNFIRLYSIDKELGDIQNLKKQILNKLYQLLPSSALRIIKGSSATSSPTDIENSSDQEWKRLETFINALKIYMDIKSLKQELEMIGTKEELERQIYELEEQYYRISREYVERVYLAKMIGSGGTIGAINIYISALEKNELGSVDSMYITSVLSSLKVWATTLKSLGRNFPLIPRLFDYVIFDEASQVDLPSAAPALFRAKQAIIVGDPMQLSHVATLTKNVDKALARKFKLTELTELYPSRIRYCDVSLYRAAENSVKDINSILFLANHYRSEDQIIELCNKVFYGGRLKILTLLDKHKYPDTISPGIHWIDCKGEVLKHPSGSRVNRTEALKVVDVLGTILNKLKNTDLTIGIVTPYSKQQDLIHELIIENFSPDVFEKHRISVLTAHKFQGSERDIMIFSLVLASRGNGNSDRWFNLYPQLLNVALSRARYALFIVGDKDYCEHHFCSFGNKCILKRLVRTYNKIKNEEKLEAASLGGKFDSKAEQILYAELLKTDLEDRGYKIVPKRVVKRYTLDIAVENAYNKVDIECDGFQHYIIDGIPIVEDIRRDEFLRREGWRVLRIPNYRIYSEIDQVIDEILKFVLHR